MSILDSIRSKSRHEWNQLIKDRVIWLRIYAQENGEKVFIIGLAFGMFVVFFFKLFIFIVALAALCYSVIMVACDSGPDKPPPAS